MSVVSRIKNYWSAFNRGREPTTDSYPYVPAPVVMSTNYNPSRLFFSGLNSKSSVSSIYNQIAVDVSSLNFNHVRLNSDGYFEEIIDSSLNYAISKDANVDQTGRALIRDVTYSLLEEGCIAVVPIVTDVDPANTESYKIYELRVAKIIQWSPNHIKVDMYDEDSGRHRQAWFEKRICAIIENPFYEIMNASNSTAKRLTRILRQIDTINDQMSSGKLDLIIELPYISKTAAKREIAKSRKQEIEAQLTNTKYGIAYIEGSEKVIQLNRPIENTLVAQEKEIRQQLYNELRYNESIFNGTADEQTMLNYINRTLEPISTAITEAMEKAWLSRTAITQNQAIQARMNAFKLVPAQKLADIADTFSRNEILTSNEIRSIIGFKPSTDPKANMLLNSNVSQSSDILNPIKNQNQEDLEGS